MKADVLIGLVEHAIKEAVAPLQLQIKQLESDLAKVQTQPGPPGPPGPAGPEGPAGQDGQGLQYCGVFMRGATYHKGDVVTHEGSAWHANEDIGMQIPGDGSKGWTLMVKHGRDLRTPKGQTT